MGASVQKHLELNSANTYTSLEGRTVSQTFQKGLQWTDTSCPQGDTGLAPSLHTCEPGVPLLS